MNEWGVKSFNRNFVRAVDEFLDRLGATGECFFPAISRLFVLAVLLLSFEAIFYNYIFIPQ